jgi:hypothetical protein
MIVLTTRPGIPLDDELLVAVSVGLAVGLDIYLAWLNRARSAAGFPGCAAALGGALLGAWLGFQATQGFAAPLAAVAGAVAGANLLLLALDVAQDRQPSIRPSVADRAALGRRPIDQPVS